MLKTSRDFVLTTDVEKKPSADIARMAIMNMQASSSEKLRRLINKRVFDKNCRSMTCTSHSFSSLKYYMANISIDLESVKPIL